jgi:hypothetical protein
MARMMARSAEQGQDAKRECGWQGKVLVWACRGPRLPAAARQAATGRRSPPSSRLQTKQPGALAAHGSCRPCTARGPGGTAVPVPPTCRVLLQLHRLQHHQHGDEAGRGDGGGAHRRQAGGRRHNEQLGGGQRHAVGLRQRGCGGGARSWMPCCWQETVNHKGMRVNQRREGCATWMPAGPRPKAQQCRGPQQQNRSCQPVTAAAAAAVAAAARHVCGAAWRLGAEA